MKLWKTEIVIWSKYNPQEVELEDLAREATYGSAYCSKQRSRFIETEYDDDWDYTEFFQGADND